MIALMYGNKAYVLYRRNSDIVACIYMYKINAQVKKKDK
jgi:hypothetical protein